MGDLVLRGSGPYPRATPRPLLRGSGPYPERARVLSFEGRSRPPQDEDAGRRRTPSHLKHGDAGRRRTPSHLKHGDAGRRRTRLAPQHEVAPKPPHPEVRGDSRASKERRFCNRPACARARQARSASEVRKITSREWLRGREGSGKQPRAHPSGTSLDTRQVRDRHTASPPPSSRRGGRRAHARA